MASPKTPMQHKFENEVRQDCDKLNNLRTDKLIISIVVFTLSCIIYSLFS